MSGFFQFLITNWPALGGSIGFIALFVMLIKLGNKMELGFKNVKHALENHDRDIKDIKAELKTHSKQLKKHTKLLNKHSKLLADHNYLLNHLLKSPVK